jgi:hypothetical protein
VEDSRQIYENFRRVFVQGKQEPVWYNVHTRRPANTEKIIDKFKSYLDRNIFSTQQLNDLGELILNAVVNSKSK